MNKEKDTKTPEITINLFELELEEFKTIFYMATKTFTTKVIDEILAEYGYKRDSKLHNTGR